ncbi:Flp family type IVb pilin [Alloalcanivorax xenomutans]|jgi:Flp pilus assembly pilin Flp|uniref:Pilus assembly protein Flp/PilA n=1 Tax=Alloalcanivorax xenomutans TaxID=1094342 RepID=A0A9Q3ZEF4_9GAMM|nr:hypothetical protein [Alloalcanivorax xenomutans]MCE7510630.1 hypothetical protein [Alloalcanivorax xenomutans]
MKMIQSINTATQFLMARLYTQLPTRSNRQRGASALEYIMLAAVVIAILVFLSTNQGVRNSIRDAFQNIFDTGGQAAQDAAGQGG